MKGWLKYLLTISAVVFFWNQISLIPENVISDSGIHEDVLQIGISVCDYDLCLPFQDKISNVHKSQSYAKRTFASYKCNLCFVKAGKILNTSCRDFCQNHLSIKHSPLAEPSEWLLYLQKLTI